MNATPARPPITRQTIEALSQKKNEPGWMTEYRLAGWDVYTQEAGKAGDLLKEIQALVEPATSAVPSDQWPDDLALVVEERGDEEGLMVQRDSTVQSRSISKEQTMRGVIFLSLEEALRMQPALVQRYFAQQLKPQDRYSALNAALWTGGSFLYVPPHTAVELPFHACYWMTTPASGIFPRTLIVADTGSRVSFVDDFLSIDWDKPALAISAVELTLHEKARVNYRQLHHWGQGVHHENRQMSSVAASGRLESSQVSDPRPVMTLERAAQLYPEVR